MPPIPNKGKIFLFSKPFRPALGTAKLPTHWVWGSFPGGKADRA